MSQVRGFAGIVPTETGGSGGGGGGTVDSVQDGTDILVNSADPANPIVSLASTISQSVLFSATPPFTATSTSKATNLNADLLDGSNASDFAAASHTHSAADIVSNQLALARGGTASDLSATGGSKQFVLQNSAAGAFTVRRIAVGDVPFSATDKLLGRSTAGAGDGEEIACTAAARTVLDDASVSAMLDTLGGASATGSGGVVRATSPTLVTPALGTPSAVVLTSGTGLPASSLVSGIVPEAVYIGLAAGLSADGKWCGITVEGTAGTTLAFGDLCYLAVADSRWELTDADAASTSGDVQLGICVLAAAADGNATRLLLLGTIRADAKFPTFTVGAPVHMSGTAGLTVVAAPTSTDSVTRRVGFALTADSMMFNPSNDYYTHT